MGIEKDGTPGDNFARGMELQARQTVFAEGCRGSCSEEVMKTFDLRDGVQPQTYGLGIKEVRNSDQTPFFGGWNWGGVGGLLASAPQAQRQVVMVSGFC